MSHVMVDWNVQGLNAADESVVVWRVLNGKRDIPAWLESNDNEPH